MLVTTAVVSDMERHAACDGALLQLTRVNNALESLRDAAQRADRLAASGWFIRTRKRGRKRGRRIERLEWA